MSLRKYLAIPIAVALASIGLATPASAAGSVTLAPADDTFVSSTNPTSTVGLNATTGRASTGKYTFVKFNVTGIPTGAPVTSATLSVVGVGSQTADILDAHALPNTWAESTATWNNKPATGALLASDNIGAGVTATFDVPVTGNGTYSFALLKDTGGDNLLGLSENGTATNRPKLVVNYGDSGPVNTSPSVNAGADSAVTLPAGVSLDGTVSDDGLPSGTLTTTWSKVSGPGTVTFGDPAAVDTTASFSVDGAYVLRLTASDGSLSSNDTMTVTVSPEPPGDTPPTVSAGTDAGVTLPASASLNGTVSDDGTVTTTWSKVSGPGTVTFGDPAAVDTTASFSVDGSYVLRLTANDGVNAAVSDDVAITVSPEPAPPVGSTFDTIGLTEAQIDSIPIGTASWNELVAMADAAYTVDPTNGTTDGIGNAVAGAMVYLRTNNTAYKTKVENALTQAQATAPANWDQAAANRHLGGLITAAQLVGKPARNTDGSLNSWGQWVNSHITVTHAGGVTRNKVLLNTARGWDNNHGAAARQSLAAIEAYLDLPLTTSCNAMKAWLGGTHAGYAFVPDTTPGANQMGWTDGAASWYDSSKYAGINPATSPGLKAGAIPSDVERDGATYPNIGSAGSDHYVYGNLYRESVAAVTLAANGCVLWNYADSALKRGQVWAQSNVPDHENDYLGNADAFLNDVYGLSYPDDVGTGENLGVLGEWLTSDNGTVTWPVR